MASVDGVITLTLPKNSDIPRNFTGSKPFTGLDSATLDLIKLAYVGTVGVPTVYVGGETLTLIKNTGEVHTGMISVSKAGRNFSFYIPSMISNFSGALSKIKSFGFRLLSASRR